MKQVNIKKQNIITNSVIFESQEECDSWLAQEESNGSFGKPERWVTDDQEDITNALETRVVVTREYQAEVLDESNAVIIPEIPEVSHLEYKMASEYSVEIIDVTAQLEQEQINREALQYLADTDWYVIRSIDGIAVPSDIQTERAAARLRIVR